MLLGSEKPASCMIHWDNLLSIRYTKANVFDSAFPGSTQKLNVYQKISNNFCWLLLKKSDEIPIYKEGYCLISNERKNKNKQQQF